MRDRLGESLHLRREAEGTLIASEPGDAGGDWEQVPDRSLVVATAGSVSITPLSATPLSATPLTTEASTVAGPPLQRPVHEEVS